MKTNSLLNLLMFSPFVVSAQLTINLSGIPPTTPSNEKIYVAGNFNNWNPSDSSKVLIPQPDGTFHLTFTPSVSTLEYKFTRGSWATVEGDSNNLSRPNRVLAYKNEPQIINNQIVGWEKAIERHSTAAANVRILSTNFLIPQLKRTRRIWVYLPPEYAKSLKRFPVLYMHDGQNLFDSATSFSGEWEVDETLNKLANQGDDGCIVVGIDNGGSDRIGEYSPWRNARYGGGDGALYAKFVVETLKPYIDAQFRTKADRLNTAVGGSSMGGLISMYMADEYQNIFSKALVFSPSFWFNEACFKQVVSQKKKFPMRFYFMSGTNEDKDMVAQIQLMASMLRGVGFKNKELKIVTKTDGQHAEWFWDREFREGYKWLFQK